MPRAVDLEPLLQRVSIPYFLVRKLKVPGVI